MPSFGECPRQDLSAYTPLQLAYIGDSVYHLMVRGTVLRQKGRLHAMHLAATDKVNAASQARTLRGLLPYLTEEEAGYVRRGRNAQAHHGAPRSASSAEYAASTAFETLIGYLYVSGQEARLKELYELTLNTLPGEEHRAG